MSIKRLAWCATVMVSTTVSASNYTVQELSPVSGWRVALASALCSDSLIAGSSTTKSTALGVTTVWNGVVPTALDNPFETSGAGSCNAQGDVVGFGRVGRLKQRAVLWSQGSATILPSLRPDQERAAAHDINAHGVVVGEAFNAAGDLFLATVWTSGSITQYAGLAEGWSSRARALNDAGMVVGVSDQNGTTPKAVAWVGGQIQLLPSMEGAAVGWAHDVNASGDVVGCHAPDATSTLQPVIWRNAQMIGLGVHLAGGCAMAINDSGTAVGHLGGLGTIWHDGVMTDANDFMPKKLRKAGWRFADCKDVDAAGRVLCLATIPGTGSIWRSFVLTPASSRQTGQARQP